MSVSISSTDLSNVKAAASSLNAELKSRTYTNEKLLFNCVDYQSEFSNLTKQLYNNDRNIINTFHLLISKLDSFRNQQLSLNEIIQSKTTQINQLQSKVEQLETENTKFSQSQVNNKIDKNIYTSQIQSLKSSNKRLNSEIDKFKSNTIDLQKKYQVEMKKKHIEIETLKNKLLDKSQLSSKEFQIPISIENNNPIIENEPVTVNDLDETKILQNELHNSSINYYSIIESITKENCQLVFFIKNLRTFIHLTNKSLNEIKYKTTDNISLPNPTDTIQFEMNDDLLKKYMNEIEDSSTITRPCLNESYKLYHNLNNIITNLNPDQGSIIKQLKNDNAKLVENWKDATKNLEIWKNLAQTS